MNILLVDSHCHLHELYKKSPAEYQVFKDSFPLFDGRIMDVGIHLQDIETRLGLLSELGSPYYSLGIYPSYAKDHHLEDLVDSLVRTFKIQMNHPYKPSACGETGIDGLYDYGPNQVPLFKAHIEISLEYNLPLIIHGRNSVDQILKVLTSYKEKPRGVMHCWSGDIDSMYRCIDLGMYISFAGNVTYKKNNDLRDALRSCPRDRLLIETDAPYLSPEPVRNSTNNPHKVHHTLNFMAKELELSPMELSTILMRNFDGLFKKVMD